MATAAPTARPPKVTREDVARLKAYKSRVTDYYAHNGDAVAAGATVMGVSTVFAEMKWLADEVRRCNGINAVDDPAKFGKAEATVLRVCEEQAEAIATGAFVKMSARIFVKYRLLVRAVDAVYRHLLGMDEVVDLGGEVPAEHRKRITLDFEDDVPDEGE